MSEVVHLLVEKGPDQGLKISVPPEGARLGRSSRNDITLNDPLLSRHHCRLFFKTGEGLYVTDLGSANGTEVNGAEVTERRLNVGDKILLGDTLLAVVQASTPSSAHKAVAGAAVAGAAAASDVGLGATQPIDTPTSVSFAEPPESGTEPSAVDLGLSKNSTQTPRKTLVPNRKILYAALAAVTLLAVLAWVHKLTRPDTGNQPVPTGTVKPREDSRALDIDYEKVQATPQNIFRYHLRLKNNSTLIVKIDDLENSRHVRKEKEVDPELLRKLALAIEDSGFFSLEERYAGIQPDVLDQWDLAITLGNNIHRSKVINRIPPEGFEKVSEIIENFGKNELGLWAIQFSSEKLTSMAQDSLQDGRKLYDSRDVAYGNLAEAIKKLSEADWYLETVEPKPDFYPNIVTLLKDCKFELHARYEDANFRAARAIKMRQWEDAATELRIIREMVPDRSDPRHKEAEKSLLEVERRIKTGT